MSGRSCDLVLDAKIVVLNPAGPSVPYMPTCVLLIPFELSPARMLGAAKATRQESHELQQMSHKQKCSNAQTPWL
jgi:hypothetical protein